MRRTVVTLGALVLLLGIASWLVPQFHRSRDPRTRASDGPSDRAADADAGDSNAGDDATSRALREAPPDDAGADAAVSATRDLQGDDPLALPSHDALAELEARGRALFVGIVHGFDGEPCPGATIFHRGKPVGVSDDLGRFRVEVAQNTWNRFVENAWNSVLAAVKPDVGAGASHCDGASRRVDVQLEWKALFAGRCVARSSLEPVALAQVELLGIAEEDWGPLFTMTATCDASGAFRFVGTPPGTVELRARAKGFASDGWFPFDVSSGLDRTGVEFQLEPQARIRGWFTPWPPPWLAEKAVAHARVVELPNAGREGGPPIDPIPRGVSADGRFELPFASSTGLDLVLEAGGGALWRDHLAGSALEGGDVDLGRIELGAPVTIRGTLALPREVLELGFGLRVTAETDGGAREFDFPVAADGTFRATPLPSGRLHWSIFVGDGIVLGDGAFGDYAEDGQQLASGAVVELGDLHPRDALIAGRVTDEHGAAAFGAIVTLALKTRSNTVIFEAVGHRGACDARGRYFFTNDIGGESDLEQEELEALRSPIRLSARRRQEIGASEEFIYPKKGVAIRLDLVMAPGKSLHGRVLGEDGTPLSFATIEIRAAPESGVVDGWMGHLATPTAEDGSFEAVGLEDADYVVSTWMGRRRVTLGRVRPGPDAVTLSPRPGE